MVGHRGYPARFPDNTMAGMALAFGVVDMVETDIRRTADGQLVLSHDPHIADLVVSETAWADLKAIDLGAGQRPILLAEALQAFPGRSFNLEVKNIPGEPGFEPNHLLAIETADVSRPGDLMSSFHWPTMDAVRSARPDVATGLLLDRDLQPDVAIAHAAELGHVAVIPEWRILTGPDGADLVKSAHDAGIGVATWTVNDDEVARRLARFGVDAIITNDPRRIVDAIEETE